MIETVLARLSASTEFQRLVGRIRDFDDLPNLGLARATRLAFLAALRAELDVPILLITDRADHSLTLHDELKLWLGPDSRRLFFPEPTPLFYEQSVGWSESTRQQRLQTLTALAAYHIPGARKLAASLAETVEASSESELSRAEERRRIWEAIRGGGSYGIPTAPVIVASVRSLMTRTLPRRDFVRHARNLRVGQVAQPASLAQDWVAAGYENANVVVQPGQFSLRGGLADIWPPAEPHPVRIDFFGDEVDTMRTFDPASQRTVGPVDRVLVTPAREFILPDRTDDVETFSEFHIPVLHPQASLLDYLPDKAIVIIDDAAAIAALASEVESQALAMRAEKIRDGRIKEDFPVPYTSWSELYDAAMYRRVIQLGPVDNLNKSDIARQFVPNPRFAGRVAAVMDHLQAQMYRGDLSVVISRQASRLEDLWQQTRPAGEGLRPVFTAGSLAEGFTYSPPGENPLHVLSDGEIFGWRRPQVRRRPEGVREAPEIAYADLEIGDWVVHIDHGIGRFMGLVGRLLDGIEREFLAVEYDDGDHLYVPIHQADRLTRYVGPDGRDPKPTKLGTQQWKNAREKVQEAVAEVAEDLLDLYARRATVQGYAFSKDGDWQRELEASFPYTETEDQLRALEEVKKDMETARPMDRLICGDVGYGKTEVALRAAFKAVFDGRQVAILVPTTVLAQQHFHTFRDRLAPYPLTVEMLSRFRTDAEQREVLYRLSKGEVDIVIGTHRLLSGDVEFEDLGLLIIDEEQRFGVAHKEKLKQMRTEVDVLTLTATPIPRTMYMALTGVRDISTINTPPEERLPIVTHVGPYSQKHVRQAILREMERGGQVFFVHNRVQTIFGMRAHLESLVPEARIGVAHGQMPEKMLSARMDEFSEGEIDVLLSTSIIESGLDIPNANTLIVDRADMFGLAQLYQLRGRVGRASSQAYAYFFKHRKRVPTPEGQARLETLAENTQLGAGMNIAMRDLEIRGAGDLLGTRQSGHIASVGFHLYTRMLAEAVQQARAGTEHEADKMPLGDLAAVYALRPAVNVDLPIPATIPVDYVEDRDTRLRLYRRLADIRRLQDADELLSEFADRFGQPPAEVIALLYQIKVKILAEAADIANIYTESKQLVLRYRKPYEDEPRFLMALGNDVRVSKNALRLAAGGGDWQERLLDVLHALAALRAA